MTADTGPRRGSSLVFLRAHAVRLASVAVLAVLVALFLRQIDVGELRASLRHADLPLVAAAFALNVPVALLFPLRSYFVLARLGHRVEARVLVPAMILGNVAGSLTPASSGELLRAAALRSHGNLPAADAIALVLFERGLSLYLLAVGTGVAAGFVALTRGQALMVAVASAPLFAAPACAPVLLRILPARRDEVRTSMAARALGHVQDVARQLSTLFEDKWLLVRWAFFTALLFAIFTLQIWLLARGISHRAGPVQVWVAFGASQLAGIASLLPFGLGAMDGSLAAILRRFGLTLEQGAATSILFRLVVTIPYAVVAIVCYVHLQRLGQRGDDASA